MTEQQIYTSLNDVFRDVFDDDAIQLNAETTAADIQGWDSQAHVALLVATEMRFGIRFRTAEFEKLKNVGELVHVIETKLRT